MVRTAITVLFAGGAVTAFAAPAGANEFDHVWECELKAGKTLDEARAVSRAWLAAARSMAARRAAAGVHPLPDHRGRQREPLRLCREGAIPRHVGRFL